MKQVIINSRLETKSEVTSMTKDLTLKIMAKKTSILTYYKASWGFVWGFHYENPVCYVNQTHCIPHLYWLLNSILEL